jgi:RNA polymerase sigma-70 factor (ECF subfamily)
MNDAELVRQALAGQRDSFAEIARRWAPRVVAICHARVRRADVADDLAQETFLRGYRALRTLSDPAKVGSWLMGIAARAALDWLKAKERGVIPFSALGPDNPLEQVLCESKEHDAFLQDDRRRVIAEIEALPESFRQVVMLYYYDDCTYRELAQLLGVSPATINARLTKARALLRERLSDCRSCTDDAR